MAKRVLGSELKAGDTIDAWWGRDTIMSFEPYNGPLFSEGSRIARFARNQTGMTIDNRDLFKRV
jgi:hypothetical protein